MPRRIINFILALITLITSCFLGAPAQAAEDSRIVASINPSSQEIDLTPGKHYTKSINVYNIGSAPFQFEVEVVPYQISGDYSHPDFTTQNDYTKLSSWITFPETKFSVNPNYAAEVKFDIDVPEGVLGGGQYAAIIIRTLDDSSGSESSVKVVAQLASIIYGHIKGSAARLQGDLVSQNIPSFLLGGEFRMTATYENTGNIDFTITELLSIREFFTNRELVSSTTATKDGFPLGTTTATVLPGTKRMVETVWPDAPAFGLFKVSRSLYYLDEIRTFDQMVFICPLWLIIVVAIFVVLIILIIITHVLNRRRERPQVF